MAIDMETIIAYAREECGQPPLTEISEALAESFYDSAVAAVNLAVGRSVSRVGEITTVAGQKEYDLPDDCIRVLRLYWGPPIPTVTRISRLLREPYDFDAAEIGEEVSGSRRHKIDTAAYQWEVMDFGEGPQLVLGKTPTTGGATIQFRYRAFSTDDSTLSEIFADVLKERIKCEMLKTRHAYWTAHEEITPSGDVTESMVEEFRRGADVCEERYKALLAERI